MKTRRNRARWIMRCSRSPDRSPVNGIPVRSPPKRPGASPTNATAAGAAPSPGTTRERHRTSDGHSAHSLIDARNCAKGSRKLVLRIGASVRVYRPGRSVTRCLKTFLMSSRRRLPFGTSWNLRHMQRPHSRWNSSVGTSGQGTLQTPSACPHRLHGSTSLPAAGNVDSIKPMVFPNRVALFARAMIGTIAPI